MVHLYTVKPNALITDNHINDDFNGKSASASLARVI